MTALPANLIDLTERAALPVRTARGVKSASAWVSVLPVSFSIMVHTALIAAAMVQEFVPTDTAAEPMFRKGQTGSTAGANVRMVKLTLEGDGFNQGRVRIEQLDAVPSAPLPVVEHAKAPQPVREPVPADMGHAVIEPTRAAQVDEGGPSLPVHGIGRSAESAGIASFAAQPMASAMIGATEQPAPASKAPTESTSVTHVTIVLAPRAAPPEASAVRPLLPVLPPIDASPPLPRTEPVEVISDKAAPPVTSASTIHATEPSSAVTQPAGVDRGAEVASLHAPKYPLDSRRRGHEGTVVLSVEVLPDGRLGEIRVVKSPGYPRLVEAAITAARNARFRPSFTGGKAVAQWIEVPFHFVIR